MKIWHHISLPPNMKLVLQQESMAYKEGYSVKQPDRLDYLLVDIDESHPIWPRVSPMLEGQINFIWTEFTEEEILAAEWLLARPAHSIGSPLPKGKSWSPRYYELGCSTCGIGWRQIVPFQISKEPSMKRHAFASFWGGFELFCTPEVVAVFESERIQGYTTWPVLIHKTRQPAQRLRQIIVPQAARAALVEELAETERFAKHICETGGHIWYDHYVRGMLPLRRAALRSDVDFQLTAEWFGNGRTARQEILVSQRVAQLVFHNNWQGMMLSPVQLV